MLSCVDDQRALLSAAPSDMIGLAVPERMKSASLTEFMNASLTTAGDGLTKFKVPLVLVEEKYKVNLNEGDSLVDLSESAY